MFNPLKEPCDLIVKHRGHIGVWFVNAFDIDNKRCVGDDTEGPRDGLVEISVVIKTGIKVITDKRGWSYIGSFQFELHFFNRIGILNMKNATYDIQTTTQINKMRVDRAIAC